MILFQELHTPVINLQHLQPPHSIHMPAQAVTSNPCVTCSFPSTVFGILDQNHCAQFLPKGKTLSPTTSKWWMSQMIREFASPLKDILSTSAICWDFQAPQASSCFHFCSLMYEIALWVLQCQPKLDFSRNWKQVIPCVKKKSNNCFKCPSPLLI